MKRVGWIGFCLSAVLAFASTAGAQSLYNPVDLGTLPGGTFSVAVSTGVNNPTQVVGFADTGAGGFPIHAFSWTKKAGMKDLGTLGGNESRALGINDGAQIVGRADLSDFVSADAFFYTAAGGMQDLGTLAQGIAGGILSQANAINFNSQTFTQIAGQSLTTDGSAYHAVIWDASLHIGDLGTLGGTNSRAFGNNCVGQVVGSSDTAGGTTDAFVWDSVHGMQDLGTSLGGSVTVAEAINCSGVIVGSSSLPGDFPTDAFMFANGTMTDLGNPGPFFSQANAINNPGKVVGFFVTPDGSDTHAFVWSSKGGMQDLNNLIPANSGWDLQSANGIGNNGRIVGTGMFNGGFHAFLLIPVR